MKIGIGIGIGYLQPWLLQQATPEVDPMGGFGFISRVQSHKGFGLNPMVPLGLFQDSLETIPALLDGDAVKSWRDELSGTSIKFIQTTGGTIPELKIIGGIPRVRVSGGTFLYANTILDGSNIIYSISLMSATSELGYTGIIIGKDESGWSDPPFMGLRPSGIEANFRDEAIPSLVFTAPTAFAAIITPTDAVLLDSSNVPVNYSLTSSDRPAVSVTVGDRVDAERRATLDITSIFIPVDDTNIIEMLEFQETLNTVV